MSNYVELFRKFFVKDARDEYLWAVRKSEGDASSVIMVDTP
jgi:hypothetical protein